ncbi:MAG: extracellular solute-binding protein [Planctomycetes bacterium]|nr:extracellular solute-binding protein [Planctomycetota bacterium]
MPVEEPQRPVPSGKTVHVRHYVLERIERGEWQAGEPLPGARDLAAAIGVSFVKVQQALESLAVDGVLELRPRVGTFVRPGWRDRVLRDHLSVFNRRPNLPWIAGMEAILARELPGLRLTDVFPGSMFEIKTVLHVQQHHDRYLDLAPLAGPALAGCGPVFDAAFAPARIGNRLMGIPIIASPRVMLFNPGVLRRHGCPLPAAGWGWDDLHDLVRRLVAVMDPGLVLDWTSRPYCWLNVVRRAGGRLFTAAGGDPVAVDSPETIRGLELFRALGALLGPRPFDQERFTAAFVAGEAALSIGTRQSMSLLRLRGADGWGSVPLPVIAGGCDTTAQAADLACVRDTCTDPELARRFVSLMLSPTVQDHLASLRYGVPVRQASAMASLDLGDPREVLVLGEMQRMSSEPCQESADLARLVIGGATRILDHSDDIARDCRELARAARLHRAAHGYEAGY